ncbi:hypothetical protein G6L89_024955 (plasmid) [Agrobacterium fabrum]|uniref:hypothetical protein n=1 Tax=Agrobacterium fabrum TaxID=1176649 RepID=UPI001572BD45|nr:hypothetical protein [Agrobacterium fabrum]NTB11062.1 hypothetical protein [Agrobacterium fabrum]
MCIRQARQKPSSSHFPVSTPADNAISTVVFLVELTQVLKEFEHSHEFTLCTPDGALPQLDINGLSPADPDTALACCVAHDSHNVWTAGSPTVR